MGYVKLQKPCTYMKCKIAIAHLEEVYQSDKFLQSPALGRRKRRLWQIGTFPRRIGNA